MFRYFYKNNFPITAINSSAAQSFNLLDKNKKFIFCSGALLTFSVAYLPAKVSLFICAGITLIGCLNDDLFNFDNHQRKVLDNLAAFLYVSPHAENTRELSEVLRKRGHCFGLSICHAAMNFIGKLDWWESALVLIANWDRSKNKLNEKVLLPGAEDEDPITLRHLFTRVLNYIVYHHCVYNDGFALENKYQLTLLNPNAQHFELLNNNGQIMTIKNRIHMSGYLAKENLYVLLDKDVIKDSLCLISRDNHQISINYDNKINQWMIYNPCYPHISRKHIHKYFISKNDLIDEIQSILGQTIVIEIAHFDLRKCKKVINHFYKIIEEEKLNIIKDTGFHLFVIYNLEYLNQLIHLIKDDKQASTALLESLTQKDRSGWTGLHVMAVYAAQHLPMILDLVNEDKNTPSMLVKALITENNKRITSLEYLSNLSNNGPLLEQIFNCIKLDINEVCLLANAKNKDNENILNKVKQNAPDFYKNVSDLVTELSGPRCYFGK